MKGMACFQGRNMKLPTRIILIVLSSIILSPTAWAFQNAVVKIYTSYNGYDYKEPWQKKGPQTCTGSGCIISGKKILTNAHVVADQSFIQVSKVGDQRKYIAEVEAVSHECDLAILRVKDEEFFVGLYP